MPLHCAQWEDWGCIANMLKVISIMGSQLRGCADCCDKDFKCVCMKNISYTYIILCLSW